MPYIARRLPESRISSGTIGAGLTQSGSTSRELPEFTNSSLNLRQPLPEPRVPQEPVRHLATGPADHPRASDAKPRGSLLQREITEAVDEVHGHLPRLIGDTSSPGAEGGWGDMRQEECKPGPANPGRP